MDGIEQQYSRQRATEVAEMCTTSGKNLPINFDQMIDSFRQLEKDSESDRIKVQVNNLTKLKTEKIDPSADLYLKLADTIEKGIEYFDKLGEK